MYPKIAILLLLCSSFSLGSDLTIEKKLEAIRFELTTYYHKLLHHLDNTIECDANCTHPERASIRKNRIHIITTLKSTKHQPAALSLNLRGNIYLPKISKKFRFTFTRQSADRLTNQQVDRENENLIGDTRLRIGLQYLFVITQKTEFATRLGIRLHKPLDLYQELSAKKSFHLYKDYRMLARASLHYYLTSLYLSRSLELTVSKPLSDRFLIAQSNDWYANTENRHERHLIHHLKLHHFYSPHNHLVYWISYASIADDRCRYRQDWQAASVSYIHYLTKWFYLQVIPRIVQRRTNRFRNDYEASVSFGMILGR